MEAIIIQLISGAIGGNLAGSIFKNISLGTIGNTLAGILGGGIGSQLLGALGLIGGAAGTMDIATIVSSVASGGVGGGVLLAIVGFVKKMMSN
jgi:uncharacterized membrane protein YeaQ/YmgE (transglycosylase-associated protein family)